MATARDSLLMSRYAATVETTGDESVGEAGPVVVEFRNGHTGQQHAFTIEEFTGGHVLHLAIAGCVSNDLFREAKARGIRLTRVKVTAAGGFDGDPCRSTGVTYDVEVEGDASVADLEDLVSRVESLAEIPSALRHGAVVRLDSREVRSTRGSRLG